jgi:hypothetical protein
MCSGCYGYLLAASEINDCVRSRQDRLVGDHSRPAGLENLHVRVRSLTRAMEPSIYSETVNF